MTERVFLIHGWSVTSTETYRDLHGRLAEAGFRLEDVYLGRYVSLDDHVEVSDIAQALHGALREKLGAPPWREPFHVVTHSTGALVLKHWILRHYVGEFCAERALRNVVFLAGPHFGSRLAHHGRSMLAYAMYLGDTGEQVLRSLELGSPFSWEENAAWHDPAHWRDKGVRPYCLTGDRVEGSTFKSRIFPAGFEKGSDMVVRVPAANLNHRHYRLDARGRLELVGEVDGVPFAALGDYVHSGPRHGIMNSIGPRSTPEKHEALGLILECLRVDSDAAHRRAARSLAAATARTRQRRGAFAQLDLRFRDDSGRPVEDYRVVLGAVVQGKDRASKTVEHTHKNRTDPSCFTVFLDLKQFEPDLTYFLSLDTRSSAELYRYEPDPLEVRVSGRKLGQLVQADRTTRIEVVVERRASHRLFVFHGGDDPDLHVEWDRSGRVTGRRG